MAKPSDRAQEILECLWMQCEEKKRDADIGVFKDGTILEELVENGYIKVKKDKVNLTDKGYKEARACVRRHRLSERLFADVFDLKKSKLHEAGCKFEHLIQEELEENICTLLGHPTECPHGTPIPPGDCCKKLKKHPQAIVRSLADLKPKEKGTIGYIHSKDKSMLQQIISLGVLPGVTIKLIRRFPSYVFEIGHSQFAIDKEMAGKIFVRP